MVHATSEIHNIDFALSEFKIADMYKSGLKLFQAMGFPVIPLKSVINDNINDFIYLKLNKRVLFNEDEHYLLDKINTISLLFSIKADNPSFKSRNDSFFNEVLFLAVDLESSLRDRSFDTQSLTKILNKIIETPIFVIFHQKNNILFSGLIYKDEKFENSEVFMSDWFPLNEINTQYLEKLRNLLFFNHCNNSLRDLYYDILYAISRDYYIYPESKEFIMFGYLSNEYKNLILEDETSFSFISIGDYAEENGNYYQKIYENDYVDNRDDIELLTANEELLFLDLDEYKFNEYDDQYEEVYNNENDINGEPNEEDVMEHLKDLDDSFFDDPLKMLEWLDNDEDEN